jgi:hypothetical protein
MYSKCIERKFKNVRLRKTEIAKHKAALRKVVDKRVASSTEKRLINQCGRFLLPLLSAVLPTLANHLFMQRAN